jgi:hypothetical protein
LLPLDDRVIEDHLLGKQVVGIYPLLPDETCLFLAADFDGKSWRDDVTAFAGTCRSFGLPVEIERSRSGDGAHAWFFFTTALPAAIARKLGSFLLTETMDRRPGIGFKSYDRLFPNQDTMPMGKKARLALSDRLAAIPADEERLLLATGRYVGEGFDDARLDTLFLVMPVSWRGTLVQYAGRIERQHPGKTEVRIIDYADRNVPILAKMFDKRLRGYRKMGYSADPKPRDARLPGL